MAAPFLLGLLLIASGAIAAAGEDDGAGLHHLELPGTADSGPAHMSDAPPPPQGLMRIMSTGGCGAFASLLAATPNASEVLQERLAAGGGGLTLLCPDDKAVAAFAPRFRALANRDRVDILLHHAAAARHDRAQLAAFEWLAVRTLAANGSQSITVRDDGDTVWLWPSPTSCCQGNAARVIETMSSSSEEGPLAVYLVDAVLVPGHLRQKLDGGYLDWLHCRVPLWAALCWFVASIVGFVLGGWVGQGVVAKLRSMDTQ